MERKDLKLPPSWCSKACRNSMNEVCVEHCAIKRDCSYFDPKRVNLLDLPPYPVKETREMTKEEKFVSVTVYVSAIVDYLQGVEYEGRDTYRIRGRRLPENVKGEDLLSDPTQGDTTHKDPEKCQDKGIRLGGLDRQADVQNRRS